MDSRESTCNARPSCRLYLLLSREQEWFAARDRQIQEGANYTRATRTTMSGRKQGCICMSRATRKISNFLPFPGVLSRISGWQWMGGRVALMPGLVTGPMDVSLHRESQKYETDRWTRCAEIKIDNFHWQTGGWIFLGNYTGLGNNWALSSSTDTADYIQGGWILGTEFQHWHSRLNTGEAE